MRKSIIIIAIVVVVLAGIFIAVPVFFKPALVEGIKTALNRQFNAEIKFEKSDISLFRNFPGVTLELHKLVIKGKEEFENDSLLAIENFRARMNLFSLFKKNEGKIDEISLIQPTLNLIVGKTGNVNWDITANSEQESEVKVKSVSETEVEPFSLQLEKIKITDAKLVYLDREINLIQVFNGVDMDVKGKMYGASTELVAEGKAENYSVDYNGVKYISNITLETKSLLNIDYEKMVIFIIESELLVNRLPMQVNGSIQIPSDSTYFDLTLKAKDSGFENFLALVPPEYEKYLAKIKTSGSGCVSGTVKGLYFDEIYPAVDFKIEVVNGNLKYADLPEEIKNIKAEISVKKPQGNLDLTEVRIKNAHVEIKNNPVDLTLLLKNLYSDPYFDGAFVGMINFDQLRNALPLDSVNVSGTIDANLFARGNYSSIEKEEYDKIKSDGIILLDNFLYDSPHLTQKILVQEGKLDFSLQSVNFSQLNVKVGQSDFKLSGKVYNYLNYFLKDGVLQGDLQLVSSFVNLNELLRLQKKQEKNKIENMNSADAQVNSPVSGSPEKLVFDVPQSIDFIFRSDIEKAVFDKLPISNIKGTITARCGKLILNGLDMNMLDGELKLSGSYENTIQNQPFVDFGLDVNKFDIPAAYQSLTGFRKMMPVAGQSQGKISTVLKMKGQLTPDFKIIPASVDGNGLLITENLRIVDSPVFKQLKGILLPEKLKNVEIDDFTGNFIIKNGNIDLKPFKTKVAGQETTVFGNLSAENLLNMKLDFKVNRDVFGNDIQNILSVIPGNKKIDMLPAGVIITGPVGNPEVKLELDEARKIVTNAAKSELQNSLDQIGKGLKKLFEK